jgi:hypothetical protein
MLLLRNLLQSGGRIIGKTIRGVKTDQTILPCVGHRLCRPFNFHLLLSVQLDCLQGVFRQIVSLSE